MTALLALLLAAAHAQDCPPDVREGERIPRSTRVRIVDVHPEDAYASNPAAVVGRVGVTTGPWTSDSCWYSGSFREANGEERYFFKVAVADAAYTDTTTGALPCPPEAHASAPLVDGTPVRLVSLHRDDPAYPRWVHLIGREGTVEDHAPRGACWMSGVLRTEDGDIELQRAALYVLPSTAAVPVRSTPREAASQPIAFDGPRIPRGQRLRILDIDPEDAYYAEREALVGLRCTTTEVMRRQSSRLFSGEMRCSDRQTHYFLKVKVQLTP